MAEKKAKLSIYLLRKIMRPKNRFSRRIRIVIVRKLRELVIFITLDYFTQNQCG